MRRFHQLSRGLFAAWCLYAGTAEPAAAQSSSLFGSSSVSARIPGGGSFGGTSGLGTMGSFGSSRTGASQSGFGMSGFGSSGFGASGLGATGANRGGAGTTGNRTGQGNFIGRNTTPGQFIGANQAASGTTGRNAGNANRQRGNRIANRNQNDQQGNPDAGNANATLSLRPRQRVGFEYSRREPVQLESHLRVRFEKLTARHQAMKGVTLTTDEQGTVVLTGEVASESAAKLAEKLVRLEPGVRTVRSELTYPVAQAR